MLLAPSLGELILDDCPQMEQVISKEKATAQLGPTSEQPFQNLARLSLRHLPKLESVYWTPLPFPALEFFQIKRCLKLRSLPLSFERTKGNRLKLDIDKESIQGVEWEDEATRQRVSDQIHIRSVPSSSSSIVLFLSILFCFREFARYGSVCQI